MATFKRYLVFQGMMFVFGIVGPIFLIVYFAAQPDPTLKWMYWAGLLVTFADVHRLGAHQEQRCEIADRFGQELTFAVRRIWE